MVKMNLKQLNNKGMQKKSFNDIKFGPHPVGTGILGTININGLTLSVIAGKGFYSTSNSDVDPFFQTADDYSAFEIAVMDQDGTYITDKFFDDDHDNGVRGWLSRDDINHLISKL